MRLLSWKVCRYTRLRNCTLDERRTVVARRSLGGWCCWHCVRNRMVLRSPQSGNTCLHTWFWLPLAVDDFDPKITFSMSYHTYHILKPPCNIHDTSLQIPASHHTPPKPHTHRKPTTLLSSLKLPLLPLFSVLTYGSPRSVDAIATLAFISNCSAYQSPKAKPSKTYNGKTPAQRS